uniref:Uncharacterized protein n=1 Tax=Noctiluca scintillans TaxID=2966 RepID=A0A7S1AT30_NOCSC|mmetsp:Transcript_57203/g.152553  ORF Transcript_57203/g.152553 Transcript_57203/m.152553 type:complete len:594 (+) Transcript_57203:111-1892(+)
MRAHFDRVVQTDETSTWKGVACHWCGRGDDDLPGTGCRLDRAQVADRVRAAAKATSTSMRRELDTLKQALWQMNSREQQMTEELRLSKEEAQSLAKQKCEQESDFNSRLKATECVRINDKAIDEALSRLCEEAPQPFVPLLEAITQCSPSLHVLSPVFQAFEEKLAACIAARDSLKEAHSHRGKEDRRLTAANRLEVDQTRDQREAASLNGPDHHHSPSQASLLPGTPAPTPSIPAVQISLMDDIRPASGWVPAQNAPTSRGAGRLRPTGGRMERGAPSANPAASQPPATDSPAEPYISFSVSSSADGAGGSPLLTSNRRILGTAVSLDARTQARRARRGFFWGGPLGGSSSACAARRSSDVRTGSATADASQRTPSAFGQSAGAPRTPRAAVKSEARGSASASLRLREFTMSSLSARQGRSPSTQSAFPATSNANGGMSNSGHLSACSTGGTSGAAVGSGLGKARHPSSRAIPGWRPSTPPGPWGTVLGVLRGAPPTAPMFGHGSGLKSAGRNEGVFNSGGFSGDLSPWIATWPPQSPHASPRPGALLPPPLPAPDASPLGRSPHGTTRPSGLVGRPRATSRGVSVGRELMP